MTLMMFFVAGCQPVQPVDLVDPAAVAVPVQEETESSIPAGASSPVATETPATDVSPTVAAMVQTQATATSVPATDAGDGPSDPEAGLAVYRAQYCGVCHVLDAAETRGTFGPPHNNMRAIAAARIQNPGYNGQAETAAGYVRESIVDPKAYIVPEYAQSSHAMPAYGHLPGEDLDALVNFLVAQ